LFLFFMGSAFCVLLLFIPPAQGWYYWILPFLIYFYTRLAPTFLVPLVALQAAYLLYFAVIPASDFGALLYRSTGYTEGSALSTWLTARGADAALVVGLAFTALQTLLLINTSLMLYRGVHAQQQSKFRARPFMIGVAGDSGAGKTTLAADIVTVLGPQRVGLICGDDMHRWERGHTRWDELTHLNPLANELHDELDFIKQLRENRRIWRRHYDHDTGQFTKKLAVKPRSLMVLEGLHTFYLKPARDLFDLKVFVKLDPDLLRHRKVVRDMQKRGATKEKVIQSIKAREADLARFIEVQERHADILISTLPVTKIAQDDIGNPDLVIQERLRITLSNAYYVSRIVSDLMEIMPGGVRHFYDAQDQQVIELDYPPEVDIIRALGEKHVVGLESFGIYCPPWRGGWYGVIQLLITFCIFSDWEERR
jgi:uridine kinase